MAVMFNYANCTCKPCEQVSLVSECRDDRGGVGRGRGFARFQFCALPELHGKFRKPLCAQLEMFCC